MIKQKSKTALILIFVVGFVVQLQAKNIKNCAKTVSNVYNKKEHHQTFAETELPLYFTDKNNDDTVYLFRGIDEATFDPSYKGEDSLIWTTLNIYEALGYAVAHVSPKSFRNGHRRVLILMYEVPKNRVYQKNSWPVLQAKDWPHSLDAIIKVAVINLNSSLISWIQKHPGEDLLLLNKLNQRSPAFSTAEGPYWVQGKKIEPYLLQAEE